MNYYKIIVNENIIGIITSQNFVCYNPITDCFYSTDETVGEYASYKGKFYRSTWMQPYTIEVAYILSEIVNINKTEYDALYEAFKVDDIVIPEEIDTGIDIENVIDMTSIDFIRQQKLLEMSTICRQTIESGFDLEIRGETHHFSLSTHDQLNLMSLSIMAQTQQLIPYHADGEEVIFYTNKEINEIIEAANAFKIYHTTYHNALKEYVNTLETIVEINAVQYGDNIPEEYQTDVFKAINT